MKRRSLLWFLASAVLAIAAGALVVYIVSRNDAGSAAPPVPKRPVVVASQPIAANSLIDVQSVTVQEREEIPSGAAVSVEDVLGGIAIRDIAQGEVIVMQDVIPPYGSGITSTRNLPMMLGDDMIAVALPADDILSKWGAVFPGDHVDVLFTMDIMIESPLLLEDIFDLGENYLVVERDQSLDNVSVLTLQNLEVLQILEEPQAQVDEQQQDDTPAELPRRALLLKIDPQDAVVLKYLLDSVGTVDLALRSPDNQSLFSVEPVNINYLVLRYGIALPQPLE